MKDIVIGRLIDPISYFFMQALNNHSLNKLIVEMNYIEVIFNLIVNRLMIKNNVSIFGHQSIWCIFKKIVSQLIATNQSNLIEMLDWNALKDKLENYYAIRYPYVKMEVNQTLNEL